MSDGRPEWIQAAERLWKEDECLRLDPDAERIGDAWQRIFGCLFFDDPLVETWDAGDQVWRLHAGGRIEVLSYDGHEIWKATEKKA